MISLILLCGCLFPPENPAPKARSDFLPGYYRLHWGFVLYEIELRRDGCCRFREGNPRGWTGVGNKKWMWTGLYTWNRRTRVLSVNDSYKGEKRYRWTATLNNQLEGTVTLDDGCRIQVRFESIPPPEDRNMITEDEKPFVSCIMPTCGRLPHYKDLIEEAVESFLAQDYPPDRCELCILNDCPGQDIYMPGSTVFNILPYQAPARIPPEDTGDRIRIYNRGTRFASLGEKYNHMIGYLTRGTHILPWEDDDISLPHRISLSVEKLGTADYFNPKAYWFLERQRGKLPGRGWLYWSEKNRAMLDALDAQDPQQTFTYFLQHEQNTGYAHNCSIYTKEAWQKVGGYPQNCRQDAGFDVLLRHQPDVRVVDGPLSLEESFFIYRWGIGPHMSGNPNPETFYTHYGQQEFQKGQFLIEPHWKRNYIQLTKTAIKNHRGN